MHNVNHTFVPNTKIYEDKFFVMPVRNSAKERIKRHASTFGIIKIT